MISFAFTIMNTQGHGWIRRSRGSSQGRWKASSLRTPGGTLGLSKKQEGGHPREEAIGNGRVSSSLYVGTAME